MPYLTPPSGFPSYSPCPINWSRELTYVSAGAHIPDTSSRTASLRQKSSHSNKPSGTTCGLPSFTSEAGRSAVGSVQLLRSTDHLFLRPGSELSQDLTHDSFMEDRSERDVYQDESSTSSSDEDLSAQGLGWNDIDLDAVRPSMRRLVALMYPGRFPHSGSQDEGHDLRPLDEQFQCSVLNGEPRCQCALFSRQGTADTSLQHPRISLTFRSSGGRSRGRAHPPNH